MIYSKDLLSTIVLDVLENYQLLVENLHPTREKQITLLKKLCENAKFDVVLKGSVCKVISDIEKQTQGWFSKRSSLLSEMLQDAVFSYTQMVTEAIIFEEQFPKAESLPTAPNISHKALLKKAKDLKVESNNTFAIS